MKGKLGYDGYDFAFNRKTLVIYSVDENGEEIIHNIYKVYWKENKIERIL